MNVVREALQTIFRMVPWSTEPGLRSVGQPGPDSPVVVTGNYDLTVRRVERALAGQDVWLVVAPSGGINVWCASSGGLLGSHQVITALKTCGVADRVTHRRAILPQLAATGVQARDVSRRCGWKVRFGPVYAKDLPRYLAAGGKKSDDMRQVSFTARERSEMALAWGGPVAILIGIGAAILHPAYALPLMGLALALAFAMFGFYDRFPKPRRMLFGAVAVAAAVGATAAAGGDAWATSTAGLGALLLSAVLTFDYSGSTPTAGGSHFEERAWRVVLDRELCRGVYSCWEVCPEACYQKPPAAEKGVDGDRTIVVAHDERCVRCGACIVQCPMDALAFEDSAGDRIEPDVIRRFKLNLLGKRSVGTEQAVSPPPA